MYQRNEEIRRLPQYLSAKCVTRIRKRGFEVKVLGLSEEQQPKANIKQHKRMVGKEKMVDFKLANNES